MVEQLQKILKNGNTTLRTIFFSTIGAYARIWFEAQKKL